MSSLLPEEIKRCREKFLRVLDDIVDPENGMTKTQYAEFLEFVLSDLECRLEALEEELQEADPAFGGTRGE